MGLLGSMATLLHHSPRLSENSASGGAGQRFAHTAAPGANYTLAWSGD